MKKTDKKKKEILLVDDNINVLTVLSDIMKTLGYLVIEAKNAQEAMEIVKQKSLDLVILDLRMPDIDGIQLMRSIKKEKEGIPVIIYSGYPSVHTAVEALKDGAVDYIAKPFDIDELKRKISDVFDKYSPK